MSNEPCPHDGDHTFGYIDFNDNNWKWHCDACRSTLSGPQPSLRQVRAAIEALAQNAETFATHAEQSPNARDTFLRLAEHSKKLIDGLLWEIQEGAFVEQYEEELRQERIARRDEAMIEEYEEAHGRS
jgi:hypothetical protein